MPPKPGKPTKAQLEEMKRLAEEERLKQEALDKKRAAEEEERQRILAEKRQIAEDKRLAEERARLLEDQSAVDERSDQMRQNAIQAAKARVRALPEKYLACDPLPDPTDETDLTCFITLWKEQTDTSLKMAVQQCQIAENVINEMQNMRGEALAMYDEKTLAKTQMYTDTMREISLRKYDVISAHILEFIEQYTKLTDDEIKKLKDTNKARGKGDLTLREKILLLEKTKDLQFTIWGNV